jgi:TolC family type I secretion outer membrane protein
MRKLGLTGALGLAAAGCALAPAANAAPLTLDDCVGLALENTLVVEQARGGLRSAQADVTGARAAFLPRIDLGGSITRAEPRLVRIGDTDVLFDEDEWNYSATANLLLFDGWGNVSSYQSASRGRSAAEDRLLATRQEVVRETERRFFEVKKTHELLGVQQEAANLSGEQLKKTQAMKDLGAATKADVYKSEVDHANNRLEVLRAQRNLDLAKAALATYLGLDPRGDIELAEEDLGVETDLTLETSLERAQQQNPELRAARRSAHANAAAVTAAKSDLWPSLSAFANKRYSWTTPTQLEDDTVDWAYGLSLDFTVFDGFLTKSRIRRAQSERLTAERTVESTERDVIFAVREAWLDLEIAREAIRVSEEAVRSSEEDLRLAQERFKIGEGTILDVIDAQVNLTRSRSNLVNATYDRRLAVTALRTAVGEVELPPAE